MAEYKNTLNLPKTTFPMKSSPQAEVERLSKWEHWSNPEPWYKKREDYYTLHDGPPFANGDIHLGHVLNKVLKDIDIRFRRVDGKVTSFRPGWDCHGLPIENKVKTNARKSDIQYGPEELTQRCAEEARKWVDIQREQFKRLGIKGHWDHPYMTMDPKYEAEVKRIWNVIKDAGLTYKAVRPVHWSVEHHTSLALAELEYKEITQTSAFVAFPMIGFESPRHLLIWTTTPWSLPGNVAVAVNPELDYALVEYCGKQYWVADSLADEVFKVEPPQGNLVIQRIPFMVQRSKGERLVGCSYKLPFGGEGKVVAADFVKANTGTGLVHIAPAHGKDDYNLAVKENLPIVNPIGTDAKFTQDFLAGKKVWEGEKLILENLKERRLLYKTVDITHEYPHDWRSGKPVITIATEQSFIALDKPFYTRADEVSGESEASIRERAIRELDNIEFVNPNGKARLKKLLEERPDWCVSRQRVWGIQIPGETDIFDVWFESGCSFFASGVYLPNVTYFEGVDQYRGWFQHSLLVSVAATGGYSSFQRIIDHGFIVGPDGKKLSKSDPNYVPAKETIDKLGSEPVRLWVSSNDFRKDVCATPAMLAEFVDKYNKIRNTIRYLLSNLYDYNGVHLDASAASLDGWMRYRAEKLLENAYHAYKKYEYHRVYSLLMNFITQDLSAIYANAMKDRLYCDAADSTARRRAQSTMMYVYSVLVVILDPILPLLTEEAMEHVKPNTKLLENRHETSDTWEVVFKLRDDALLQLERLKKDASLNKATDAQLSFTFQDRYKFDSYGNDLEDMVGAGYHSVMQGKEDSVTVFDGRELDAACQRSWKRRPDVKEGLSERDRKVVENAKTS